jgi:hypothetical protein
MRCLCLFYSDELGKQGGDSSRYLGSFGKGRLSSNCWMSLRLWVIFSMGQRFSQIEGIFSKRVHRCSLK